MKKKVSDEQYKHQQIFVLKGMISNIRKIAKKFPDLGFNVSQPTGFLSLFIRRIKTYTGPIRRT